MVNHISNRGGDLIVAHDVKIPIKVGLQRKYDAIAHNPAIIYICSDSGNIYLGDKPIGGSNSVLFYTSEEIPKDFGAVGQKCVTPYGVYEKSAETGEWERFSRWSITSNGELAIDGVVPIANKEKVGFVRSSEEDGEISVKEDGTMAVNGWDDIEVSLNFIYRSE